MWLVLRRPLWLGRPLQVTRTRDSASFFFQKKRVLHVPLGHNVTQFFICGMHHIMLHVPRHVRSGPTSTLHLELSWKWMACPRFRMHIKYPHTEQVVSLHLHDSRECNVFLCSAHPRRLVGSGSERFPRKGRFKLGGDLPPISSENVVHHPRTWCRCIIRERGASGFCLLNF